MCGFLASLPAQVGFACCEGLVETARENNVPNIKIRYTRIPAQADGAKIGWTLGLSFGDPNAPTVVITGGIHAREWIAPEIAYLVAE